MWALVPFKILSAAKQRLAPALTPEQRAGLSLAMLHDVLAALRLVPALSGIALLTRDAEGARLAAAFGIEVITEAAGETQLNDSLTHAIRTLGARAAQEFFVLHADLPLAAAAEIDALIAAHRASAARTGITLVPDRQGTGTNALLATPADAVPLQFGPASLARFQRAAERQGIRPHLSETPSLTLDIDTPDDLRMLRQRLASSAAAVAIETRKFLATIPPPGDRLDRAAIAALE